MKLIVVDRAKLQTFQRLTYQFAGARDVKVVLDRRVKQIRKQKIAGHYPERRTSDRRKLLKSWKGRDYIVVHLADGPGAAPAAAR
jgi:hypothetical protein